MLKLKFEKAVVYAKKVHTINVVVEAEGRMVLYEMFSERLKEEMGLLTEAFSGNWSFSIKDAKVGIYQDSDDPYGKGDANHKIEFTSGAYYVDDKRDW